MRRGAGLVVRHVELSKILVGLFFSGNPKVMDEFGNSRPANLQASHIGTCILKTYSSIDPEG